MKVRSENKWLGTIFGCRDLDYEIIQIQCVVWRLLNKQEENANA